jgi:hypothetical protein
MISIIILHLVNILFKIAASLKGNQTKKNVVHTRFHWGNLRGEKNTTCKVPRPRLEDNIRLDLKSVGTEWTGLMWLVVGGK